MSSEGLTNKTVIDKIGGRIDNKQSIADLEIELFSVIISFECASQNLASLFPILQDYTISCRITHILGRLLIGK